MSETVKGLVIKSTGNVYTLLGEEGRRYTAMVKGEFKLRGLRTTNPVAVGDHVIMEPSDSADPDAPGWIVDIAPRTNYIIRRSSNLSKESQILGANLDRAVLIITVNFPYTSTTFIDRFLSTAEAYRVPVTLIFNKVDRYRLDEKHDMEMLEALYSGIGYPCFAVSAKSGMGMDQVAEHLSHGVTLLSGHSGVGKSTFINTLVPGINLRTGEISEAHHTGTHTTTYSEMIPFREGYLIDTPGIKGFGTIDFEKEQVGHYFPDIFNLSKGCKFSNCTHTHEPECNVLKALRTGMLARSRYNSYLSIYNNDEDEKYRVGY